jgi:Mlc titration factor MtfA (ptsG expression regulator)
VILSWRDALEGAAIVDDGRNVVIHEFAHQLDQEKGYANGAPDLRDQSNYRRWSRILSAAFSDLQFQVASGQASLFGTYAASNPAEFFAVVSEVFFEQAQRMADEHPDLYRELSHYYRLDPLAWS